MYDIYDIYMYMTCNVCIVCNVSIVSILVNVYNALHALLSSLQHRTECCLGGPVPSSSLSSIWGKNMTVLFSQSNLILQSSPRRECRLTSQNLARSPENAGKFCWLHLKKNITTKMILSHFCENP